jgi:hypothetical protein
MFQKSRKLLESRGGYRSRGLNTVSSQLYLVISPRTSDPSIFGQVSFIRRRTLSSVSCAPWRTRGRADSFPTIHPTATVPTCRRRRNGAVYVQPSGIWECRAATAKSTAPWNPLGFECRFGRRTRRVMRVPFTCCWSGVGDCRCHTRRSHKDLQTCLIRSNRAS